jgi:nucleotide-binding universal stress UspA family protein
MVQLELGHSNASLLRITGDLAERFHASVIGIAVCQPMQIVYGDDFISGEIIEQNYEEIEKDVKAAEAEFRSSLHNRVSDIEWRSAVTFASLSDYLAHQARSTDVVITHVHRNDAAIDPSRRVNVSDLVMQIGRPILTVPTALERLKFDHVIIGWKDTQETRRAVAHALPVLKQAGHIDVVEIAAAGQLATAQARVADVAGWLKRHGIVTEPIAVTSTGDDARQLDTIAQERAADLMVAGAYGHSRLREWVLGGVTRDLLLRSNRCSLISH